LGNLVLFFGEFDTLVTHGQHFLKKQFRLPNWLIDEKNLSDSDDKKHTILDKNEWDDTLAEKMIEVLGECKTLSKSQVMVNDDIDFAKVKRVKEFPMLPGNKHKFGSSCYLATYLGESVVMKDLNLHEFKHDGQDMVNEDDKLATKLQGHVKFLKSINLPEEINFMNYISGTILNEENKIIIVSHREKCSLQLYLTRNKPLKLFKKVELIKELIKMLLILKNNHGLNHLGLHPHNILISPQKHVKLSDIGFNNLIRIHGNYDVDDKKTIASKYIDPDFFDDTKRKDELFEKYDVYSVAKIAEEFLYMDMTEKGIKDLIHDALSPFFLLPIEERGTLDQLEDLFKDKSFLNQLYGAVDNFWEQEIKESDIPLNDFLERFFVFFNPTKTDESLKKGKNIMKSMSLPIKEWDGRMIAIRLMLNCKIVYNPVDKKNVFMVSRDNYSRAYALLRDIMYKKEKDGEEDIDVPNDAHYILEFLRDIFDKFPFFYGIISEEKAHALINKLALTTNSKGYEKANCLYVVYAPIETRGQWKITYKLTKKSLAQKITNPKKGNPRLFDCEPFSYKQFRVIFETVQAKNVQIMGEHDVLIPDEDDIHDLYKHPSESIKLTNTGVYLANNMVRTGDDDAKKEVSILQSDMEKEGEKKDDD